MKKTKVVPTETLDEPCSEMCPNILISLLCGLPGAGKSYLVRKIMETFESFKIEIIHYDELVDQNLDLSLDSWKSRRSKVVSDCKNKVEALKMQRSLTCNSNHLPYVLLIDDNMFLKSMRYTYYQLARDCKVSFCQIFVDTNPDKCLKRIEARENAGESCHSIGEETFHRIRTKFETPNPEKNYWEENTLKVRCIDDFISCKELILHLFNTSLKSAVPPAVNPAEKVVCGVDSFVHQADLVLRSMVKEQIVQCDSGSRASYAKDLADIKKLLLKLFETKSSLEIEEMLVFYSSEVRQKILKMLRLLNWPSLTWDPPHNCAQTVTECFSLLIQNKK